MDRDYAAKKGPLDLNKGCPAPVDGSPFFSYFSIFKRMHHFFDSHDAEVKYSWSSTIPTLMPSILLLPPPAYTGEVLLGLTSMNRHLGAKQPP